MAELVWEQKYVDGVRSQPCRSVFPFEPIEVHGAGRPGLAKGSEAPVDRLIVGDKTQVLPSLLPALRGRVALAYLDPPFETGGDFAFLATIPGAPDEAPRLRVPAYRDARGLDAWLAWFHDTAVLVHELMADGASLYVHLDAHAAHYARVVLDEVFGTKAFQREIIWRIGWVSGFKSRVRGWVRNHDTLLFFAKGSRPSTFHKAYVAYPQGYTRRDGSLPRGPGRPLEDVWNASDLDRLDSIQIKSFSVEKVGYPTQKNEALVARIVRASSNPGDIVLDCFVGSGTTAVVARKLGRHFVVSDIAPVALHATRKRLLAAEPTAPFVIERIGPHSHEAGAHEAGGQDLGAQLCVRGREATIALTRFGVPAGVSSEARAVAAHWSQWIDDWCVDWDHAGGPLRVASRMHRLEARAPLPLVARHTYESAGAKSAWVRAYDVLGGMTETRLAVSVET